ncbi:flagellar basal body-associated FliL family protein [Undibacterium fentianense]|uniref:Flagellar protein FliL n=1 Tax=Undibacterium fentianense TaxID=2828728 RepID=A0A941IFM6_9BURK|nr:flagellar basal body-associated FliL family protein [Undibacterium fentianense]MBR7799185.1 flagellar basal body-associated FliL family protein [Undibacterium fentianense]
MKSSVKNNGDKSGKTSSDRFAIYAAVVVLVFFGIVTYFIYQSRMPGKNDAELSYVELKQTIVNDQGMVARLAVTVQVNNGDEGWLSDNEEQLNAQFKKELTSIDLSSLRTKEGFVELQDELKRRFNLVFKTDKIQAVMVTEILLQDQR